MTPIASSAERPAVFTALIVAGAVLLVILAAAGRSPLTHALAVTYVAAVGGAVAGKAARR